MNWVLHQLGNLSEWIPFQALFKQHGLDRLFQQSGNNEPGLIAMWFGSSTPCKINLLSHRQSKTPARPSSWLTHFDKQNCTTTSLVPQPVSFRIEETDGKCSMFILAPKTNHQQPIAVLKNGKLRESFDGNEFKHHPTRGARQPLGAEIIPVSFGIKALTPGSSFQELVSLQRLQSYLYT